MSKIIAVTGATGSQGGAVVKALLADGTFQVRALTRNPESEGAKKLSALGHVEVVKGDLDQPDTLAAAFAGCYGMFLVTNFYDHMDAEREIKQANTAADAAVAAGVQHIVFSTLEDTRQALADAPDVATLPGNWKCAHLDAKWQATEYMRSKGLPVTHLVTSCYMDNFLTYFRPRKADDGSLSVVLPHLDGADIAWISVEDIGKATAALFKQGPSTAGQVLGVAAEYASPAEAVATLAAALGQPITLAGLSFDEYEAMLRQFMSEFGATDMVNMFKYFQYGQEQFKSLRPLTTLRGLVPGAQTLAQWATAHKEALTAGL